jgi:type 1 glutamine amidotransferase
MNLNYTHDCTKCIYLGSIKKRHPGDNAIDCYVCLDKENPSLHSIIGRFGSEGEEYYSSHPPEAFTAKMEYLELADRWYLFALHQMIRRGLYTLPPIE